MKRKHLLTSLVLVAALAAAIILLLRGDPAVELRRAAFEGDVGTVRRLIKEHPEVVDITRPADPSDTPGNSTFEHMWLSVKYQLSNAFQKLDRMGFSALEIAVVRGHRGVADALLEGGANPSRIGSLRTTAIHQVVQRREIDMIELFAKHKADLNALDGVGLPPLAWIINTRDLKVAELLLDLGADPNAANGAPLFRAILHKNLAMTKLLVERGANVNITDRTRRTPVKAAKDIDAQDILAYLRSKGGRDSDGQQQATPE